MSIRKRTYFQIPDSVSIAAVARWLRRSVKCEKTGSYQSRHTFLDSFDSRLYRAGLIIEMETIGDSSTVQRHSLRDGSVSSALSVLCPPRFSGDFPPGVLRRELRTLLDIRALLPVAETNSMVKHFSVRDNHDEDVLSLFIDKPATVKNAGTVPGPILYLESAEGQEKLHDQIVNRIAGQFSVHPAPLPLMATAMQASGYLPGEYSATSSVDLQPLMRADVALRAILMRQFDIMRANEEGVVTNLDTEFLHDYRVAIRRTRSIIGRIKGVVPEQRSEQLLENLRWLGEITGPGRDMDVYLLNFSDFEALLPQSMRKHIAPLHIYLERHARIAHEQLVEQFGSERYQTAIDDWRQLLATMDFRKRPARHAERPILEVASKSIWKMYKKVIRQGKAIDDDSPPEDLHSLRKSCKKLRYLLEAFHSLFPRKEMKWVVGQLKTLQQLLGEYQDLHVHSITLRYFCKEMHKEMEVNEMTDQTIEMLGGGFDEKQVILRKDVMANFLKFATDEHYQRVKKLFK